MLYAFKTREGGMGVLQFMGFTEKPKGVKIRYKMVQAAQPATPTGIKLGLSKAELMGNVEKFFMNNYRDISSRKSLEWGDVARHEDGSYSIRYKYRATIWDKETLIDNKIFTFGPEGNFVAVKNVEGFPKKERKKPKQVKTKEQLIELVEEFFGNNFRDITSRETIAWADFQKQEDGNVSIRYKYRATIWDKDKLVMNQTFIFNPEGKFISVKNVEGFPKKIR